MLTERDLHVDVRTMLMNNEPFQYAHLIKFERPSRPDARSGKVSTSANRYTYITDASRDVPFDDGSTDVNGVANGSQNYVANKVLNVSNVQEATEAKASNFTVTLDGNGIGGTLTATVGVTNGTGAGGVYSDLDFPDDVDILAQGFREGDKIFINQNAGAWQMYANIVSFMSGNVLRVKLVPETAYNSGINGGIYTTTISLASEEIKSILLNKNAADYASFINREVYIYRAYFQNGVMVGATPDVNGKRGPMLLFKGIISNVSFEDEEDGIKVQWGLTSHWGDFAQVRGRVTSDDFHRALDHNGQPQPESAIKPAYAYDKGFMHAETSVNLLATYNVQVEKQKIKSKSGFLGLGIGSKVKVKKYFVTEERNTNLDFQLAAKSIPLIYGVRNVTGIPVFADTLKTNANTIYVVYVLSEGQIGGIYDVYIDGKSLICNNEADLTTRGQQNSENSIEVVCRGRADRGDVLSGSNSVGAPGTAVEYYDTTLLNEVFTRFFGAGNFTRFTTYNPPVTTVTYSTTGAGVIDGETIRLTQPLDFTLDFFSGTEGQKAASSLVTIAKAGNFKVQTDYWTGSESTDYWGPNHRLLDTAYIVAKYTIAEGETSIPDLEFIVRGKAICCYNYDYSYAHDEKATTENAANFPLGSTVTLKNSTGGTTLNSNVQIIDKWTFRRPDGVLETRFRFSVTPSLGYVDNIPTIKRFYMENGSAQTWTMTTFDYVIDSGVIPSDITTPATEGSSGGVVTITPTTAPVGGDPVQTIPTYSITGTSNPTNEGALVTGTYSGGVITTRYSSSLWSLQ